MEEPTFSTDTLDIRTLQSRLREIEESLVNHEDTGVSESLVDLSVKDLALQIEQVVSDCSDFSNFGIEDLDEFLKHLKEELKTAEAETTKISSEIELLSIKNTEESKILSSELEQFTSSLDFMSHQDPQRVMNVSGSDDCFSLGDQSSSVMTNEYLHLEILKLENQIEENKVILKTLEDCELKFKRFDIIDKIEGALSGINVIDYDGNCIRLAVQTYISKSEDVSHSIDDIAEPYEVNHELLIEVTNEHMEPKNVEIFPNNVYIAEIIEVAKSRSYRHCFSHTKSTLEWFVRRVQNRIVQCALRQLAAKKASKSRHAFEYSDREETFVTHMAGGVDAHIKVPQGWPLISYPLKLELLKRSKFHQSEVSSSLLSRVKDMADSLDANVRHDLSSFVDEIEKMLSKATHGKFNCVDH